MNGRKKDEDVTRNVFIGRNKLENNLDDLKTCVEIVISLREGMHSHKVLSVYELHQVFSWERPFSTIEVGQFRVSHFELYAKFCVLCSEKLNKELHQPSSLMQKSRLVFQGEGV